MTNPICNAEPLPVGRPTPKLRGRVHLAKTRLLRLQGMKFWVKVLDLLFLGGFAKDVLFLKCLNVQGCLLEVFLTGWWGVYRAVFGVFLACFQAIHRMVPLLTFVISNGSKRSGFSHFWNCMGFNRKKNKQGNLQNFKACQLFLLTSCPELWGFGCVFFDLLGWLKEVFSWWNRAWWKLPTATTKGLTSNTVRFDFSQVSFRGCQTTRPCPL